MKKATKIKNSQVTHKQYLQGRTAEFGIAEVDGQDVVVRSIEHGSRTEWVPATDAVAIAQVLRSKSKPLITSVESLGHGKTRIGADGYGWMDVSAVYADTPQGWTVAIERTNIEDEAVRERMLAEYRRREGMGE